MKTKGELMKIKKLTIVAIVAVISTLLFLGGQALSKRSGFTPNYDAIFTGHIEGGGPVAWKPEYSIHSDASTSDYELEFSGEGSFWVDDSGKDFKGWHEGWLAMVVDKKAGRALFEYRWSEGGNNYDLSGHGSFESNKKEGSFTFTSDGEMYTLVQWFRAPPYTPSIELWWGYPEFTISGTHLGG